MIVQPFGMIEKAVRQVIETGYPTAAGKIGGDFNYDPATQDFFVWMSLVPGGATDEIEGNWVVDVDVFAPTYTSAMRKSLDLETVLLKRYHDTTEMRLDRTYQNEAPAERPWDDDTVFRVGATYSFAARRSG